MVKRKPRYDNSRSDPVSDTDSHSRENDQRQEKGQDVLRMRLRKLRYARQLSQTTVNNRGLLQRATAPLLSVDILSLDLNLSLF